MEQTTNNDYQNPTVSASTDSVPFAGYTVPLPTGNGSSRVKKDSRKTAYIVFCVFGVLCGVAAIVLSIIVFDYTPGWSKTFTTTGGVYGADFYTDMSQGVSDITHNTADIYYRLGDVIEILRLGFGSLLVVFGVSDIFYFISKILKPTKTEPNAQIAKSQAANDIPEI